MKLAIIAYAFDRARIQFFERFRAALNERNIKLIIITNRPALAREYPLACCLSRTLRNPTIRDDELVYDSLEFRVGNRDLDAGRRLVCALDDCIHALQQEYKLQAVFIWNGSALPERVMARFAGEHKVSTLYFENSNIPGRMIIDGEGVNAQCSIATKPELLANYPSPLSHKQFEDWKRDYIAGQRSSHKIFQARGVRQVNWSFLYDIIYQQLSGIPRFEMFPILTKVRRKLDALFYRPKNRYLEVLPEHFVFLPLQVQSDTQLVFNSGINNEEAIKHISCALEPGQALLVKQHPAEPDKSAQRFYSKVIAEYGAVEVSNNTFELMLAAEKIYTINSTAGLQAKLMGKPVECLGRAVFAEMSDEALNCYAHGFLTSIDLFEDKCISVDCLNSILNRAKTLSENSDFSEAI